LVYASPNLRMMAFMDERPSITVAPTSGLAGD
jgi:hypothetical protein